MPLNSTGVFGREMGLSEPLFVSIFLYVLLELNCFVDSRKLDLFLEEFVYDSPPNIAEAFS